MPIVRKKRIYSLCDLEKETERLAIMTVMGGLNETEARVALTGKEVVESTQKETLPVVKTSEGKEETITNIKVQIYNPNSKLSYLEFWYKGELLGGKHIAPENEEEVVGRFYEKYGVRLGTVRERVTPEARAQLFRWGK
jgi:hypothetical protein